MSGTTLDEAAADPQQVIADLKRKLAQSNAERDARTAERDEALAREIATTEVLQVINSSPGDLTPVFDALLEKAMRLCEAAFGFMSSTDDGLLRPVAARGVPAAFEEFRRHNPPPATSPIGSRVLKGEPFIHTVDLKAESSYERGDPQRRALVDLGDARTSLVVTLKGARAVLGAIHIYRKEVRPFSENQIALLQNFAAQAVIAMENARLITETREALERQTANAQVLGVINSSPGNLTPVFDAMLEKAMRLCGAAHGTLTTYDGEEFQCVASHSLPEGLFEVLRRPRRAATNTAQKRLLQGERIVHIADSAALPPSLENEVLSAAVELGGVRTILFVPLRKDDTLLGYITANRKEVRPFSDKQIALLQNFAAQAVIGMENARLVTETREALEQQTATAEVLGVINASRGDLAPVFDAILEKAHNLCRIAFGSLQLFEGGRVRAVAVRGMADSLAELLRDPIEPLPGAPPSRLLGGERFVQIADMAEAAKQGSDNPRVQASAANGMRTALFVPLRKDTDLLGYIVGFRKEVQLFSDKEIALLENFAAQAVIAMENARLITETREALERQTATAEVLQVINSSPGEIAPVFEAVLVKAHTLCGAARGTLFLFDGETFRAAAVHGYPEDLAALLRQRRSISQASMFAPLLTGARLVHNPDLTLIDDPTARAVGGVRTNLLLPLRRDGELLGL